ncbi:response regulator transcription factor [Synechococcus sp. Nb3U1]|uniref:response regulator n=1 Tax=Synechococcus sp. Nb3U1 TaxID=1914529 RepID=UPI001F2405C7|nr:response regulator transcription factor [Synechococcus sp. Nb3U1]MCF2970759.1 response regulator transcription factor [Synechococcus sp. Nb3U1]
MQATLLTLTSPLPQVKEASPLAETLLVVDDEDAIRETIAIALEEQGYRVLQATDGRQALELVHTSERLDLVILDLMLPSLNGLDLCRLLRREGNTIPILMLTAKSSETDRVVGLELGADDYLTKPFGMRELIARCRSVLRRQQQSQVSDATVLRHGELCMFTQECRVLVRGIEVNFSPKEFRLLELFMGNPRRVWTREQLLERIWGSDFMGDSKTVDVHIRWLREKLELDPSSPEYLVTVRGFGYRFG